MLRAGLREVVRQIDSALFERAVLGPPKVSTALRELHPGAESVYRDAYCVEFPGLPAMRRVYSSLMPRPDSARSGVFSLVNAQMADRTPPIILADFSYPNDLFQHQAERDVASHPALYVDTDLPRRAESQPHAEALVQVAFIDIGHPGNTGQCEHFGQAV